MKKIILTFILLFNISYATIDYNQLNADRQYCYKIMTSQCFYKLIDKYSAAPQKTKNYLRYDYAIGLMAEEDYARAKENFRTVLFHEKENKKLIQDTNQKINQIEELYRKMATANNLDGGSYYDKNKSNPIWQKAYNIKIYISSNTGKEDILKKAFDVWDDRMFKTINFSYVNDSQSADIIIGFVNNLAGNTAGITKYTKTYQIGSKEYLQKVNVDVALDNPKGGTYTDSNLLSIALHEIGHALGITYHSDNINDIMYFSTESYKNSSISHRDLNTLKQIYR